MAANITNSSGNQNEGSQDAWNLHKETIIDLYIAEDWRLTDVRTFMAQQHSFDKTRRQYQNRFLKWGVYKNLKKEEKENVSRYADMAGTGKKEELIHRIESGEEAFHGKGQGIKNLSRKLRRHQYDEANRRNVDNLTSFPEEDVGSGPQVGTPLTYGLLNSPARPAETIASSANGRTSSEYLQSPNLQFPPGDSLGLANSLGVEHWRSDGALTAPYPTSLSISPTPAGDPTTLDLNRLLICIQATSDSMLGSSFETSKPTAKLEGLWPNVHNCIYLYKLDDVKMAEVLLQQLCSLSSDVLLHLSIDVLRQLLAAFAPVNFQRHPQVRMKLLGHFTRMAEEALGHDNTFTTICRELQKDEDPRNNTEMGLRCMLSSMQLESSPLAFDIEREIIALLRRNKAFDDAIPMAESLVHFNNSSVKPRSEEKRKADKELAHIYMDIGRLEDAKILCLRRVGNAVARDGLIGHEYHDRITLSALEDLAKIEEESGAMENSATWLQHAAYLAKDIKGPSPTLTHILDKLMKALIYCGRSDDAGTLSRDYESYVWRHDMDVTKS